MNGNSSIPPQSPGSPEKQKQQKSPQSKENLRTHVSCVHSPILLLAEVCISSSSVHSPSCWLQPSPILSHYKILLHLIMNFFTHEEKWITEHSKNAVEEDSLQRVSPVFPPRARHFAGSLHKRQCCMLLGKICTLFYRLFFKNLSCLK